LKEEMGIEAKLDHKTHFIYNTAFDNGLTEHEFDHIFYGYTSDTPEINTTEVAGYKWLTPASILEEIKADPKKFTSWFKIAMEKLF
ncbi:MAG: NUDIX domain-containing protein, partial [Bacteroidia bacterium]